MICKTIIYKNKLNARTNNLNTDLGELSNFPQEKISRIWREEPIACPVLIF